MSEKLRVLAGLSMADAQRLYGVTARALRLYDDWGLVQASRGRQNQRFFDGEARRRLEWIVKLRAVGVSLADIRDVLDAKQDSRCELAIARAKLDARRAELAEQLVAIDAQRRALRGDGGMGLDSPALPVASQSVALGYRRAAGR